MIDKVYDWRYDLPDAEQQKKFKDLYYLNDVYANLDRYRIENLRRLSKKQYDEVEV